LRPQRPKPKSKILVISKFSENLRSGKKITGRTERF